jgi:hypothetical protein
MVKFFSRITALAVILVMVGMAAIVEAQDDDDALLIPILDNDDRVVSEFDETANMHLYGFFGSEGDTVTISMMPGDTSIIDPYLILLNSSGRVVASDDDGGETLYASLIEDVQLPADDFYLLLATEFTGLRFGTDDLGTDSIDEDLTYELAIEGINAPDNADDIEIDAELINAGETIQLDIGVSQAVAFVFFEGEGGDLVTIGTDDIGDNVDTILYVFDPIGLRVGVNDDRDEDTYSRIESLELPDDGLYLIMATGYEFELTSDRTLDWSEEGGIALSLSN